MKNFAIAIVLLISLHFPSLGQDFKKIEYQFNVGTTLTFPSKKIVEQWTDISGHPVTEFRTGFGYFLEMNASYPLSPRFSIGAGMTYNFSAHQVDSKVGVFEKKGNINKTYINVPVLASFLISSKIPLTVSMGPYFGVLVHAKEQGTSYIHVDATDGTDPAFQTPLKSKYSTNMKDIFDATDMGVSTQVSYEIQISEKLRTVLLTRFNLGINNVVSEGKSIYSLEAWNTYNLLTGFGLKF